MCTSEYGRLTSRHCFGATSKRYHSPINSDILRWSQILCNSVYDDDYAVNACFKINTLAAKCYFGALCCLGILIVVAVGVALGVFLGGTMLLLASMFMRR
jgi:hypothetical protein